MIEVASGILFSRKSTEGLWILAKENKKKGTCVVRPAWGGAPETVTPDDLVEVTDHSTHSLPIGLVKAASGGDLWRGVFDQYVRVANPQEAFEAITKDAKVNWTTNHYYAVIDDCVQPLRVTNKVPDLAQLEVQFAEGGILVLGGWWAYERFLIQGEVVEVVKV
jgi:hypothetical protein